MYTGPGEKKVVKMAESSKTGAGTNLIAGLGYGMESTFFSVLVFAAAIMGGHALFSFYGV